MGGNGATTFDRVTEYCDGWMPISMRAGDLAERIPALKRQVEAAGRDPESISISVFAVKPDQAFIENLEGEGVERSIFLLPPAGREVVLPLLDRYAGLMT